MTAVSRIAAAGAAAFILLYFLTLSAPGLVTYFNPDDAMNLYGSWVQPFSQLLKANLAYFLPSVRPLGGAFYVLLYTLFGWNAPAFTAVRFALLALNLGIAFALVRRVTGSRETAALATLLFACHSAMADLYGSSGTFYDILCFTGYYSALLVYLRKPRNLLLMAVLLVAALNAKEMAISLPAVLVAWNWLDRRPRDWAGPAVAGFLVALFLAGHLAIRGPLSNHPAYTPVFTVSRIRDTALSYVNQVFYAWPGGGDGVVGWFTPLRLALLLAGTYAAARWLRSKPMEFGWWLAALGVSPLLLSTPRPGYALYLPMLGLALYAAVLLIELRARLAGELELPVRAAFCLAVAVALVWVHLTCRQRVISTGPGGETQMRAIASELLRRAPAIRKGSRILFLDTPFEEHTLMEFTHLLYHDRTLQVRAGSGGSLLSDYDYAFEWRDGGLRAIKLPGRTPLRAFIRVQDRDAPDHFVKDIVRDRNGGAYGWTYQNPELDFRVEPAPGLRLVVEFVITEVTFRQTGTQTVEFLVNGTLVGRERYTEPGLKTFQRNLPPACLQGEQARVAMHIAPPYVAAGDGAKLGVLLLAAGFTR